MKRERMLKGILSYMPDKWVRWSSSGLIIVDSVENVNLKDILSKRQLEVFRLAKQYGYYDFPKRINLNNFSKKIGIAPSSVCVVLQKVESRVFSVLL